MVMVTNICRILLFAIFSCFIACNRNEEVRPELLCIKDSKPCTDSLVKVRGGYNERFLELVYSVKNSTDKKLYLPIRAYLFNDSIKSTISVYLENQNDTIKPIFRINKIPYNKDVIDAGDSMLIFVRLYNFPSWQKKWCNVNTDAEDIVSKLRLRYVRSDKDVNNTAKRISITFDDNPKNYKHYVIPRGSSIDVI